MSVGRKGVHVPVAAGVLALSHAKAGRIVSHISIQSADCMCMPWHLLLLLALQSNDMTLLALKCRLTRKAMLPPDR